MKLLPLTALALAGCAQLQAIGITPASAPMLLAVAAEMRAGANVIRADARGDRLAVRLWCFRIRQARTGADGTIVLGMSEDAKAALHRSRDLTDDVCVAAGVPAAGPVSAEVAPPPTSSL
jgi:hypothetical protein